MFKNIWKSISTKNKIKYKIKKNVLECGIEENVQRLLYYLALIPDT